MNICKTCGTIFEQIKKTGKVGCPDCYDCFFNEIKDALSITEYKGSLPKRTKGYHSILADKMTLQIKLEEAISNEEYEKAALYRDYLKVLKDGKF